MNKKYLLTSTGVRWVKLNEYIEDARKHGAAIFTEEVERRGELHTSSGKKHLVGCFTPKEYGEKCANRASQQWKRTAWDIETPTGLDSA